MEEGAILLRVVLRLLGATAAPRALPALGPVDRRGAPAPAAAAQPDPHGRLFLSRGVVPAGSLLGSSSCSPDSGGLPAAGL